MSYRIESEVLQKRANIEIHLPFTALLNHASDEMLLISQKSQRDIDNYFDAYDRANLYVVANHVCV